MWRLEKIGQSSRLCPTGNEKVPKGDLREGGGGEEREVEVSLQGIIHIEIRKGKITPSGEKDTIKSFKEG